MAHNGPVLIRHLRESTIADHEAVEAAMPLMRADLDAELYRRTLERVYGLVLPWEELAERTAAGRLGEMVRERSRRQLLARDLAVLGTDAATLPMAQLPEVGSKAALLGAMYVMEGSRLGGQLIARHVEAVLGERGRQSVTYFRGFGDATGAMWKRFVAVLEEDVPDTETERAVKAARQMFATFGGWMSGIELPARSAEAAMERRVH